MVYIVWSSLPSFVNEIHHQGTEDEENEQSNKHVVDGPDVVHLKQLTGENASSRRLDVTASESGVRKDELI